MIPFRTTAPTARVPAATVGLILLNVAVFLFQMGLGPRDEMMFLFHFALVPAAYTHPAEVPAGGIWTLLTNTFMHGGFLHLIFNMWTLWLFGCSVEGRLPTWRFVGFYLSCGVLASAGHLVANLDSTIPALGASGAIAGILGGFSRLFLRAKVTVVVPIIIIPVIFSVPAVAYTAVWFGIQVWQGISDLGLAAGQTSGIAWWAHIVGFAAGLVLIDVFGDPDRRPATDGEDEVPPPPSGIRIRPGPWSRRPAGGGRRGPWS